MHYVFLGIDAASAAIFVWIIGTFAYCLATESGSIWQRILAAGRDSATIVWSKIIMAASAFVALLVDLANAMGDPQVAQWMKDHLTADRVAYITFAVMVVTVLARKRTL